MWSDVAERIGMALETLSGPLVGLSSLAGGADQVFARVVLGKGGRIEAVIPIRGYRDLMQDEVAEGFDELVGRSSVIELDLGGSHEEAFLNAGKWIVDHSELMIAVWDGKPAEGKGGTADVVAYAREVGRRVIVIDVDSADPNIGKASA